MNFADTEATSPHTPRRVEEAAGFGTVLSGGPPVDLADAGRFSASLVFEQNLWRWIVLNGSAPADCAPTAPALLAQLEPIFGAFHAAPGPSETEEGVAMTSR